MPNTAHLDGIIRPDDEDMRATLSHLQCDEGNASLPRVHAERQLNANILPWP